MPRATKSTAATAIIQFFRKAPMENAELVLDLCKDEIKQRKALGENIRAAQQKAATRKAKLVAAAASPAAPVKAKGKPGPKKGSTRKKVHAGLQFDADVYEADPGATTAPPPQ